MRVVAVIVLGLQVLLMQSALAADTTSLADQAAFRHYAIEEGAPVDVDAMEQLVTDLPDTPALYFVALAEDPPQGADVVARDILTALPGGTVIVVTPTDLGTVSSDFSDGQLSDALDAGIDLYDTSYVEGFRAFANVLTGAPMITATAAGSSGGGGAGVLVPVLLIGGVIVLVVVLMRKGKKGDEEIERRRVEEARDEIKTQLDAIANRIIELSDQVSITANDEATEHYRAATTTFDAAQGAFESADTLAALEDLSDRLDRARWQLEAADAISEGRSAPPEPQDRPSSCFFDPAHRGGTEEGTITTPAGVKIVSVCHECAEKLRNGERPRSRDILVGGRRVPAPMAPRSHGGGGLDWMDVFQMAVAGMGTAAQYRSRSPRRRVGSSRSRSIRRTAVIPRSRVSVGRSAPSKMTGRARRRRR
ncbi:MAG TPA: hypothetical protein ENH00_05930 [Actinobacteria bacterium]|nr:hypothetical protein BMS3Bbin01_01490 [bacterium BMS3Bbin01]HDH25717.1 hypothetical protein [Actinomycetota bacterium]